MILMCCGVWACAVRSVLRSTGAESFSRVLAETAARYCWIEPVARLPGMDRLRCQLTNVPAVGTLHASFAGAIKMYADESDGVVTLEGAPAQDFSRMQDAARRLQAMLSSASVLTSAELKRFRREVAKSVHPDLCPDEYKKEAEELMKSVNVLVAQALDASARP